MELSFVHNKSTQDTLALKMLHNFRLINNLNIQTAKMNIEQYTRCYKDLMQNNASQKTKNIYLAKLNDWKEQLRLYEIQFETLVRIAARGKQERPYMRFSRKYRKIIDIKISRRTKPTHRLITDESDHSSYCFVGDKIDMYFADCCVVCGTYTNVVIIDTIVSPSNPNADNCYCSDCSDQLVVINL